MNIELTEEDFKNLFYKLIATGRDMESRDRAGLYYVSVDTLYKQQLQRIVSENEEALKHV